jgi:ATP phosphoribosyltransferase regulatory subunit
MNRGKRILPYGVKDYYPEELNHLKNILKISEEELNLWGYKEIKLPYLEFKKLFETVEENINDDFIFTGDNGEILSLRYDFTPQLVRFVLHNANREIPYRIYYKGETFKRSRELWEELNLGFELIGGETVEADAEIIAVIKTIFEKLEVKNYKIVIGHRKAYESLKERIPENYLLNKIYDAKYEKEEYLKLYPLEGKEWESQKLPADVKEEIETLRELFKSYNLLGENVLFYPAMEPKRKYYSGLFFEFVHPKGILARGGRYDNLFKKFGEDIPATGGGIKVQKLVEVSKKGEKPGKGIYIIDTTKGKVLSWKLARILREKGIPAVRDLVKRDIETSIDVARKKGFAKIMIIGNYKTNDKDIMVIESQKLENTLKVKKEILKKLGL